MEHAYRPIIIQDQRGPCKYARVRPLCHVYEVKAAVNAEAALAMPRPKERRLHGGDWDGLRFRT